MTSLCGSIAVEAEWRRIPRHKDREGQMTSQPENNRNAKLVVKLTEKLMFAACDRNGLIAAVAIVAVIAVPVARSMH
jgi:hypothetical protein